MIRPQDSRKSLDSKDRPWNWSFVKWTEHQAKCHSLMGIMPEQPSKPDPDDEVMVMLNTGSIFAHSTEVKYLRDMRPSDYSRINCYLPSVNQMKAIYGKKEAS